MFITPPEKIYTYSTSWKVIAWMPLVAVGLIAAAGVAPDFQDLLLPGWIIALGATAALSVFWWLYLSRSSISVHSEGITRSGLFGAKDIRWDQIQETRYAQTTTAQSVGVHFGLIGILIAAAASRKSDASKATQNLKVVSQDGTAISVGNFIQNHRELMLTILARVNLRLLNDFRSRIKQGIPVEFGKLQLSMEGVRWGSKGPLPYQQIETTGVFGSSFRIKSAGKWMSFLSVRTSKVPKLFVAIDLIEELKSGITKSQVQQLSFALAI